MEVIKIVGIALVALVIIILLKQYRPEFAVSVCKDSGEAAIASKIEMGTKIIIISMSIPIISSLLEVILKVLP